MLLLKTFVEARAASSFVAGLNLFVRCCCDGVQCLVSVQIKFVDSEKRFVGLSELFVGVAVVSTARY